MASGNHQGIKGLCDACRPRVPCTPRKALVGQQIAEVRRHRQAKGSQDEERREVVAVSVGFIDSLRGERVKAGGEREGGEP